ncbi:MULTISPECIES: nucleoside deaminase [Pseudomonas syringae group]|uniref:nucleoside deaminase n=1 Tax=Pseudomonas syringae group TaxID=136849 RepID=UPI0001AF35A0|nr:MULTISPECIES: nucleoside deaminase [Pseudomonas syringae group]KPZ21139.1 Cytosine deaminase [Pseudomonas coronafaciens pv. zizaniae]MCF5805296.1 nucleoside deaminase [Pseudomonas tremae]MCF5807674.1 nucleoside deaminase [Pseudomonas tremae]MCQ3015494.1 nucleoside deaminase [Pseudomonas tremae]QGL55998.1 nucleoside deaminase [Pseudomonas coronafaciens pv. oryzae str. 1_6]
MDAFMRAAFEEAQHGQEEGGIPIGSVIVHDGKIIGRGRNRRVQNASATLHGEMDALENAGRQPASVYREAVLYTTLSPCAMCSGAILLYGIRKVIVGENQSFMGEEDLLRSRGVQIDVLDDAACKHMMQNFINNKPDLWNEDIGE